MPAAMVESVPLKPQPIVRRIGRRKRSQILFFACCANLCDGFSVRNQVVRYINHAPSAESIRTRSRLFDQRGPSDTQDPLFFAQDLLEKSDAPYDQNVDDSASQSQSGAYFYNVQSAISDIQGGGVEAYDEQFSAMNSQVEESALETELINTEQYESWGAPENQAPVEQTGEAFTTQTTSDATSQPISSVDARVLESILQEGKLDLTTEEEVKRLLEGPRIVDEGAGSPEAGNGEYSSKFVSVSIFLCIHLNIFGNSIPI